MKKFLFCILTVFAVLVQANANSFAKTDGYTQAAIQKYKQGNYTGCLQDCQNIVQLNPNNSMAYYYMAISYVKIGDSDSAIRAYSAVLDLNPQSKLADYAKVGKLCAQNPKECSAALQKEDEKLHPKPKIQKASTHKLAPKKDDSTDLDKFIAIPPTDGMSKAVRKDYAQKQLESIKNQINNNKDIDPYSLRRINQSDVNDKTAQKKPTEEDVAEAIKILNEAGINNYGNYNAASYQNPELSQINMLMGGNNPSQDSNSMLNMLPYMMTQSKSGNGENNYSSQLMQAVMMNSMMNSFNVNLDLDKNKQQ